MGKHSNTRFNLTTMLHSWLTASALASCGGVPMVDRVAKPEPPKMPEQFHNKCDATKGQLRPLVVEWPATDRALLEAKAQHGQLVVHYEGCELNVLTECKSPQKLAYTYTGITPKDEDVNINNDQDLYANIPVHAAEFEAKLAQTGKLTAAMHIVGMYESTGVSPATDQLEGECTGATHVVASIAVGAFEFSAGASSDASASASLFGAGVGGKSDSSKETLSRDGNIRACDSAHHDDKSPPEGCGALLRLELLPVRAKGQGEVECKPGTRKVKSECQPIPKTAELAPEDVAGADTRSAFDWGNNCFKHFQSGMLSYARAACQSGLTLDSEPKIKGAIFYNLGLVEEKTGDLKAACEAYRQSLAIRPNGAVQRKFYDVKCPDVAAASAR